MDTIIEMLSYPFMVRAFVVGSLVALCSALLGVSLVLKRYSMIGDGLSHVGFGALAVAASLNLGAPYGGDPGGDPGGRAAPSHPWEQPDQRGRGDRTHLHQFAGGGRDGDLHDHGDEYRCL